MQHRIIQHGTTTRASLALVAALAGCSVVSPQHLEELRDGATQGDGQTPEVPYDETCLGPDDTPLLLVSDTTRDIMIDTTSYSNDNSSACGAETPGNDAFVAIDVQPGAIWHFHLRALSPGRLPMLYFARAGDCDPRECDFVSTACVGSGDEHFAFEGNAPGIWYVGVDDSAPGGGLYKLDIYRPRCGDGQELHGEACEKELSEGCDDRCRVELSTLRSGEQEPNDNRVEANALVFPAANELVISGDIGGEAACTYDDVFALTVPDMGDIEIHALQSDGATPCASSSTTPFDLALEDAAGRTVVENRTDTTTGCALIEASDLPGGTYFVRLGITVETLEVALYYLRFRVLP